MNIVCLVGNLSSDVDFHHGEKNDVSKFSLAVEREYKQEGGQTADFPRIVVFGKQAENCKKYLSKGKKVAVRGRIQTGSYENKDGKRVYTTDVLADRVEFLTPKGNDIEPEAPEDDFLQLNEEIPF